MVLLHSMVVLNYLFWLYSYRDYSADVHTAWLLIILKNLPFLSNTKKGQWKSFADEIVVVMFIICKTLVLVSTKVVERELILFTNKRG